VSQRDEQLFGRRGTEQVLPGGYILHARLGYERGKYCLLSRGLELRRRGWQLP
jgi:hypothetical protein